LFAFASALEPAVGGITGVVLPPGAPSFAVPSTSGGPALPFRNGLRLLFTWALTWPRLRPGFLMTLAKRSMHFRSMALPLIGKHSGLSAVCCFAGSRGVDCFPPFCARGFRSQERLCRGCCTGASCPVVPHFGLGVGGLPRLWCLLALGLCLLPHWCGELACG
jgi:hypothetical protein